MTTKTKVGDNLIGMLLNASVLWISFLTV
jgi:hypothetical protein